MPRRSLVSLGLVLGVLFAGSQPIRAQVRFDVAPLIGYYRPLGAFDDASVYSTRLPATPQDLSGFAWGGAAHLWFGGHLGAEFQVVDASSTIASVITPGGPTPPTSAHVLMASAQALYVLSGSAEAPRLWVGAGPGIVHHGGDAYAPYDSPTEVAATVSLGSAIPITSHLHATLGVDMLFYTFDLPLPPPLQQNPGSLEHGAQSDALVHVGVSWTLGGALNRELRAQSAS